MRETRRLPLALILPLTLLAIGCGSRPSSPPVGANLDPKVIADELAKLTGAWEYERQVGEGREIPLAELGKSTVAISGNKMVRRVFRTDGHELTPIRSTISVDPTASPKQMDDDADVGFRIRRRLGIYKLDGDTLTLCYDNTGGQRPTAFESPVGSSFVLTVLRRQVK